MRQNSRPQAHFRKGELSLEQLEPFNAPLESDLRGIAGLYQLDERLALAAIYSRWAMQLIQSARAMQAAGAGAQVHEVVLVEAMPGIDFAGNAIEPTAAARQAN